MSEHLGLDHETTEKHTDSVPNSIKGGASKPMLWRAFASKLDMLPQ
jgi:hypothetical protein